MPAIEIADDSTAAV
jgi:hypothetical protein